MRNSIITAETVIKDELKNDPTKDLFPITLIKFLLNRKKIINFFNRTQQEIKNIPSYIDFNHELCDACNNNSRGLLCRKHTSINRVLRSHDACFDIATGIFMYMNEMFKSNDEGNVMSIIYAPHTKLIQGKLTDYKVKKISTISTYPNEKIDFQSRLDNIVYFNSNELMNMYIKCWFNDEFSLITIPRETDSEDDLSFCLIPNR